MAHAVGDSHPFPIYGAHYLIVFPILDNDGDPVSSAAGLDSEVSTDLGTIADCTNEATEIGSSGMYYLYLTGAEMTGKIIAGITKTSTTDAKTTPWVVYPKRLPVLESGTAQAGAAGTITLASGASAKDDFYNGLYVLVTNDSPSGARYQARKIVDYVGSTKVATIESDWGTNPDNTSTYDILVPETVGVAAWAGVKVEDPTTAGLPNINVDEWLGAAVNALQSGRVDSYVGAMAAAVLTASAIAAEAIGASELATDAVQEIRDAITAALNDPTAAAIADAVLDELLSGHATAGSLGKKINDMALRKIRL